MAYKEKVLHALREVPLMTLNGIQVADIIELLQAEPVEPKRYPETRYNGPLVACGDCLHELMDKKPKFCPYCGKPVKWEE